MSKSDSSDVNTAYFKAVIARQPRSLWSRVKSSLRPVFEPLAWPFIRLALWPARRCLTISNPDRIGHLAIEPDWLLRKRALGLMPDDRLVLLIRDPQRIANSALLDVWRQHIDVIDSGWRRLILSKMPVSKHNIIDGGEAIVALGGAAEYPSVLNTWAERLPIARLPPAQAAIGRDVLRRLGVPDNAWHVCLHNREGGYSPTDEHVHNHRNATIINYALAVREIARRGGWVVRMGDHSMEPLPTGEGAWPNTVDYANCDFQHPAADIALTATSRFMLATTSGLNTVATIFGVPVAYVNMVPHGAGLGQAPRDIAIMKHISKNGRRLTWVETLGSEIGNLRVAALYAERGLEVVENTPDEIHALTKEMLDQLDGTLPPETEEDIDLRKRFTALMQPHHYCYHVKGTVGRAFLRQHRELLDAPEPRE